MSQQNALFGNYASALSILHGLRKNVPFQHQAIWVHCLGTVLIRRALYRYVEALTAMYACVSFFGHPHSLREEWNDVEILLAQVKASCLKNVDLLQDALCLETEFWIATDRRREVEEGPCSSFH